MRKYISEPIPYTTDIDFLYRWDSRSPEVIRKDGFQGAVNLYFNMIFGLKTVFSHQRKMVLNIISKS